MKTYTLRHQHTGNRFAIVAASHRAAYVLLCETIGADADRYTLESVI